MVMVAMVIMGGVIMVVMIGVAMIAMIYRRTLCRMTMLRACACGTAVRRMSVSGVVAGRGIPVTRGVRPSSMIVGVMMCGHGARA